MNADIHEARKEKEAEIKFYNDIRFQAWEKANKLDYQEFIGWMKGEDLKVIKVKAQ